MEKHQGVSCWGQRSLYYGFHGNSGETGSAGLGLAGLSCTGPWGVGAALSFLTPGQAALRGGQSAITGLGLVVPCKKRASGE